MLRRIFRPSAAPARRHHTGESVAAPPPIFPTRDEVVARAFTALQVQTAHATTLAVSGGTPSLVHEHDPQPERQVILFRSTTMAQIGVIAAPGDLDLYEGALVGPLLPVLLVEQAETGRVALRSPIREAHLCALQPEGSPAWGGTDFYRHWIGPWELFSTERIARPILMKQAEAALAQLGRLLESGLNPAFVTAWLAETAAAPDPLSRTLATQVLVHLLARSQIVASAVRWNEDRTHDVHLRAQQPSTVCVPVDGPLLRLDEIRPRPGEGLDPRLRGAWGNDAHGNWVATGERVVADFLLPERPTHARLRLDIQASHHPILMSVSVNGWRVGRTALGLRKVHGSRLEYWIPKEAMTSGALSVALDLDPAPPVAHAFPYAFELLSCALDAGPAAFQATVTEDAGALMAAFESLGEDCEFGFVQRHFGIEPMGIFRFGGFAHLCNVVTLLQSDLEGLGAPGSLVALDDTARIYRDPEPVLAFPEYYMRDQRLQLGYHTWKGPQDLSREDAVLENEQKLTYLRRKFLEDLEDAEKIWLFKDTRREDPNEVFALYDLLNRHGPNKLFWITRAIEGRPSGSIEWMGPRLLRGYSNQPHVDAQRFVPATWLELCRNAHAAFAERQ